MQFLQLGLIFIILISVVIIVFKIISFILPIIAWIIGILLLGGIIGMFGMIFYNSLKRK